MVSFKRKTADVLSLFPPFKRYIDRRYYKIEKGLLFANYVFQRICRINSKTPWMVNFCSRVTVSERIKIKDGPLAYRTYQSFAVSRDCYIQGINGIEFGEGVLFGPGVKIISSNHDLYDYDRGKNDLPIRLGDKVWIGANAVILPGVELGESVVVGAGAVVTKSFPPNVTVVGVPARQIG